MRPNPVKRLHVFVIESPSAIDALANRTESQTLEAVCKLLGHSISCTSVRSDTEFRTALKHITSINEDNLPESARGRPLCLHLAAHGNDTGLAWGPDDMTWEELANELWTFFQNMTHYSGPIILVISACGAEHQTDLPPFHVPVAVRVGSTVTVAFAAKAAGVW